MQFLIIIFFLIASGSYSSVMAGPIDKEDKHKGRPKKWLTTEQIEELKADFLRNNEKLVRGFFNQVTPEMEETFRQVQELKYQEQLQTDKRIKKIKTNIGVLDQFLKSHFGSIFDQYLSECKTVLDKGSQYIKWAKFSPFEDAFDTKFDAIKTITSSENIMERIFKSFTISGKHKKIIREAHAASSASLSREKNASSALPTKPRPSLFLAPLQLHHHPYPSVNFVDPSTPETPQALMLRTQQYNAVQTTQSYVPGYVPVLLSSTSFNHLDLHEPSTPETPQSWALFNVGSQHNTTGQKPRARLYGEMVESQEEQKSSFQPVQKKPKTDQISDEEWIKMFQQ